MRMRPCRGDSDRVRVRSGRRDAEPMRVLARPGGAEAVRMIAICCRVVDCVIGIKTAAIFSPVIIRTVIVAKGRGAFSCVLTPCAMMMRSVR